MLQLQSFLMFLNQFLLPHENLKNLLDGNKLKSDIQFKKLCINSNDIDPGDIFVALKILPKEMEINI